MITFTENYGESHVRASERCFHLVLLTRPFTRSLPARYRIQWLTRSKPLKLFCFETAIGDFSGGYFMNKTNDCLLIRLINAEKQLHFDFESVYDCYLGMSSLSNKWKPFF